MKLFIWQHNRKYHSWSMISEPCVHHNLYTKAVVMVAAETEEQALALVSQKEGWRVEDLKLITPRVLPLTEPTLVWEELQGE